MIDVIITGSTGFVGHNLKKFLNRGFSLTCPQREELVSLSLSGDSIIHLAGKAHDLKNVSSENEYYKVNYELTMNLYDSFLKSDLQKFIFISSVKASADRVETILDESSAPNPQTYYGKSKLKAEDYIQSQQLPEGKSWYILRPCMIHGPGNKGNLNLLYKFVVKGIPYPLAAFDNKRSLLSVENLCFVIREILVRNDIPSGVYQVADDEPISTNELVKLIAKTSRKASRMWNINPALILSLAKIGDFLKLPLTTERLNKLTDNYIVSNAKLKKALGKELPVHARSGIENTINSFKTERPI